MMAVSPPASTIMEKGVDRMEMTLLHGTENIDMPESCRNIGFAVI